jgi:hypothetical protein
MKTSAEDNAIYEAMDKLFTQAKAGDEEALAIIAEIFREHFKEMQKISFREQMRRNHKAWCQYYKLNHKF